MNIQSRNKNILHVIIVIFIWLFSIFFVLQGDIEINKYCFSLTQNISNHLHGKLIYEKDIPHALWNQASRNQTLIYVLGGNQDSLTHRFRKSSVLYHQGVSNKILILSRPGITEYDPDLGRNLTNNEWAIRELEKFFVKKADIEPVPVEASFFGTLSEAKDIPDVARKKGYSKLVLVTSAYHTKRTFSVFSKFAQNHSIELYIYGSDDDSGLGSILLEHLKLFLYENIVIHIYRWKEPLVRTVNDPRTTLLGFPTVSMWRVRLGNDWIEGEQISS